MNGRFYLAAIIVVLLGVAAVFVDPLYVIILALTPLIWIGVPLVLLAVVDLLLAVRSRRSRRHAFTLLAINDLLGAARSGRSRRHAFTLLAVVGGCGCFAGLVLPANYYFHERAVADAKAFPAKVAPLLEAYRQEHGVYPPSLDQLPSGTPVPWLLRGSDYTTHGQSYTFTFPQPGKLKDTWDYDSKTQTWFPSAADCGNSDTPPE